MNWSAIAPIGLLAGSNLLMNLAWYGHLKAPGRALWLAVLFSWGIALFEYCLAVPANRIGTLNGWSAGQLKIAQEAIALIVFGGFMVVVLKEPLHWRHLAAFACIMAAVGFLFTGK